VSQPRAPDIDLIQQALALLPGPARVSRINVGFSGGLDSSVLLHMVWCWWQSQDPATRPSLRAIHINHQMQTAADQWQAQCARFCLDLDIEFLGQRVTVDAALASPELAARNARYDCFAQNLQADEVLLLAHHRDDQVETLLQRLARGSGPLGMGAMTAYSTHHGYGLLRPLLELDRNQLEHYAQAHHLRWIDDPSNGDVALERNFIRHRLLPLWRSARPGLNQTLARAARLSQETAGLLHQLAAMDLGAPRADGGLPVAMLQQLEPARGRNLLRYWLQQQGVRAPSATRLLRILEEVVPAAEDAQPCVEWDGFSVRRFQGCLYGVPADLPRHLDAVLPLDPGGKPLSLPVGTLLAAGSPLAFSRRALQQSAVSVTFRQGGERLQLPGRPLKTLKDLFQEQGVPPWLRGLWPILYQQERIVGLPDLWVCEGFQAISPADGVAYHWSRPGVLCD